MRWFAVLLFPFLLSACTAESVWAPDEAVAQARYQHPGPKTITLVTVLNNRSNEGAHSALLINGSERVIFDPAGSWYSRYSPERNDVHFGMTPRQWNFYVDYHSRETFRTQIQTIEVTPEVAEMALQLAKNYGAVPKAFCANSTSDILGQLPGFESISRGFYPAKISAAFAELPGVRSQVIRDDDPDDNKYLLQVPEL